MPSANNNNRAMLVILYISAFVAGFNENIMNVALHDICAEFGVSSTTVQWLVTGYMILTSVIVAIMAFLSRRFTARGLFFTASLFLIIGEIGCFIAPTFPVLLVCRIIQATGSGIYIPLMMNAAIALSPRDHVGFALSIGSAMITLGPALAPVLSGAMVTFFGWRSIFVIPAVCAIVLSLLAIRTVTDFGETGKPKFDALSVALAALGLTAFVYGVGEITTNTILAVVCIVVSLLLIALFAHRQDTLAEPILNLKPMRNAHFAVASILVIIGMMMTFSMSVLLPMYFEGSFGYTALVAGALILPAIILNALTAMWGGHIMDSRGTWPLLPFGFALIFVGMLAISLVSGSLNSLAVTLLSVVVYAGVGFVLSPCQTAGLRELTPDLHPHGVSILNTFIMVAASIGPSLFIGVLSSSAASAEASGMSAEAAQAHGFANATMVAAVIALCGLVIATFLAWRTRNFTATPVPVETKPQANPVEIDGVPSSSNVNASQKSTASRKTAAPVA